MTLIEIAQQAESNRLFKHDADDSECYTCEGLDVTLKEREYT